MTDASNPLLEDDDELDFGISPKGSLSEPELPDYSELQLPAIADEPMPSGLDFSKPLKSDTFEMDESLPEVFAQEEADAEREAGPMLGGPASEQLSSLLAGLEGFDLPERRYEDGEELTDTSDSDKSEAAHFSFNGELDVDDEFSAKTLDLDKVIASAIDAGASDIHLSSHDEVAFTILGSIHRYSEFGEITGNMTTQLQQSIISNVLEDDFVQDLELDTSYVVRTGKYKGRRLRLSIGRGEGEVFMVFRVIAASMPTPDELDIPQAMRDWVNLPSGLVLVNGPTNSGKSTTLSSLIQEIQFSRAEKVISIEKPIEYVYGVKPGQKAFITQREVGRDAHTFASALTSAMRQAPNIILVGEVRNRTEIDELLRAAETGHLALSTLHTTSCPATLNRIRSMYEGDEQLRVLSTLADNLRGLMTQTLVKSPDGKSRYAVREVLQIDAELKELVLRGDTLGIRAYQEARGITMEHELVKAVRNGKASLASARSKAPNPLYFDEIYED